MRIRGVARWALLLFALVLALACVDENAAPDAQVSSQDATVPIEDAAPTLDVTRPGVIWHFEIESIMSVPATGAVGAIIPISVQTFGGGCESPVSTEVDYLGGGATVTPLDRTYIPPAGTCSLALRRFEHTTKLQFDTAGTKVVRVVGRWRGFGGGVVDEPYEVTRTIKIE